LGYSSAALPVPSLSKVGLRFISCLVLVVEKAPRHIRIFKQLTFFSCAEWFRDQDDYVSTQRRERALADYVRSNNLRVELVKAQPIPIGCWDIW
jgi:hypothetical protein